MVQETISSSSSSFSTTANNSNSNKLTGEPTGTANNYSTTNSYSTFADPNTSTANVLNADDLNLLQELQNAATLKSPSPNSSGFYDNQDNMFVGAFEPFSTSAAASASAWIVPLYTALKRHFLNELNSPVLLPFMPAQEWESLLELLKGRLKQLSNSDPSSSILYNLVQALTNGNGSGSVSESVAIRQVRRIQVIGQMECERLAHLMKSYLRIRLDKIEEYSFSIDIGEEEEDEPEDEMEDDNEEKSRKASTLRSAIDLNGVLTPFEVVYWKNYNEAVVRLLNESFQGTLEHFDLTCYSTPEEIPKMDYKSPVAVRLVANAPDAPPATDSIYMPILDKNVQVMADDVFLQPFENVQKNLSSRQYELI